MRILVITNLYPPDFLGGYEMGCRQAADALRAAGHEVLVLTTVPRALDAPPAPHVARRLHLADLYDQYCEWKSTPLTRALRHQQACGVHAFNVHALGQAVEEFRPDAAYVWNVIGLGGLGLLAALQHMGVPWVMHLMDDVVRTLCRVSQDAARPVRPAVADTFARVSRGRFICCSQTTLDEITTGGVDIAGNTTIIPNWVTTAGSPDRSDYMPNGHLRVVSAGGMSINKGMDIIIKSAGLLRDRGHHNFSIDLYGPGTDPLFRTLVQSLRLEDRVRLRGPRTQAELDALYPDYDVFAFPTWPREPFGFAPMEAMAHGCAAVASRVCGFSEWFLDGSDCVKIDRTPAALADALERFLRGELDPAVVGQRGGRSVLRHFRLSALLPKIEAELAAAVRTGGGVRRPAAEAYRVALLAEKSFQCLIHEAAA